MWQSLRASTFLKSGLVGGIGVGLLFAVIVGLIALLANGVSGVLSGLASGLLVGLLFCPISGATSESVERILKNQRARGYATRNGCLVGLASGLVSGLIFGVLGVLCGVGVGLLEEQGKGLLLWLIIGAGAGIVFGGVAIFINGLVVWLTYSREKERTAEVERNTANSFFTLCLQIILEAIKNQPLKKGMTIGVVFGLSFGWLGWLTSGPSVGLSIGLILGLIFGLYSGLILGVIRGVADGLRSELIDNHEKNIPNQGIRRSAQNGIFVWLIGWLISGLLIGLPIGLLTGLQGGLKNGLLLGSICVLFFGLLSGLENGLSYGGTAYIQHVILRLYFWRTKCIPWNFVHFLNYATYRILLYRIGSGYSFIHRLFLEYIASLDTQPLQHTAEQSTVQTSRMCSCGHQEKRPGAQFCPNCGKSMM